MGVGCDERRDRFGARFDPMHSVIGSFGIPKYMDTSVLTIHDPVLDKIPSGDTRVTGAEMNAGIPMSSLRRVCPRIA
jgi:hypothetical protein